MLLGNYTVNIFYVGVASRLYWCNISNGCILVRHTTKITPHCMDQTKSFMFLIPEWIITLPKWQDYCHLFRKLGLGSNMETHILLITVPASRSTFSLIFAYRKSTSPYYSYFLCGEDHSLFIHKKYEICDISVLHFPKNDIDKEG